MKYECAYEYRDYKMSENDSAYFKRASVRNTVYKIVLTILIISTIFSALYITALMFLPNGSYCMHTDRFGMEVGKINHYMIVTAGSDDCYMIVEPFRIRFVNNRIQIN